MAAEVQHHHSVGKITDHLETVLAASDLTGRLLRQILGRIERLARHLT